MKLLQAEAAAVPRSFLMPYEKSPLRAVTGDCLRPGGLELTRHALDLCSFPPRARLLDLGCGPGASLGLLRERGFEGIGLDRSGVLLAEARLRAPCVQADFAAPPFADQSLDGILCECALSLARDKERVLRECGRTLRPGGRLLLSDLAATGGAAPGARIPCVAGALAASGWLALLHACGFSIIHVEDCGHLLRDLAARIVWTYGSLEAFTSLWPAGEEAPASCPQGGKSGYILIIAQNNGEYP